MKLEISITSKFKKEYKSVLNRGYDPRLLRNVVKILADGETLPEKYKDHFLLGNWVGYRECHITPDWLLIYKIEDDILVLTLTRTGTHSDLF